MKFVPRVVSSIIRWSLFGLVIAAIACGATPWEGSVDAVFRYRQTDQTLVVYEVKSGSFSHVAGLQAGDAILTIDSKSVAGLPFEEVHKLLQGPTGTHALLKIERGGAVMEISIERRPKKEAK